MRALTLKIGDDLLELLDKICSEFRISRSEAIRMAIVNMADKLKDEPFPRTRVEKKKQSDIINKARHKLISKERINIIELRDMDDSTKDEPIPKAHIEKMKL